MYDVPDPQMTMVVLRPSVRAPRDGIATLVRAPTIATMGLWECDLATEELLWSDGVYDLFGLQRGQRIDRHAIAAQYARQSRVDLELARLEAIRDCRSFMLDAEIMVAGESRWIRIVAQAEAVDGVAVRLFGSKHDVTFERTVWATQGRQVDVRPNAAPVVSPSIPALATVQLRR